MRRVNTVVVGGGTAGVAASLALKQQGLSHVLLEKGELFDNWKHLRWDAFKLNTPDGFSRLLGQGGLPGSEMKLGLDFHSQVARWMEHVSTNKLPVFEGCKVVSVKKDGDQFVVRADNGTQTGEAFTCDNVISCVGEYQIPKVPEMANSLDVHIKQHKLGTYHGPESLYDGGVLIVGSGQSGIQLADQLSRAGKKVMLATSKTGGCPRSFMGQDIFFWMDKTKIWYDAKEDVPLEKQNAAAPFTGSEYPISYYSLAKQGVEIFGSLSSVEADGVTCNMSSNLKENIDHADMTYNMFVQLFGAKAEEIKDQSPESTSRKPSVKKNGSHTLLSWTVLPTHPRP